MDTNNAKYLLDSIPNGINNPSNFCYIISTIQALFNCIPFINAINSFKAYDTLIPKILKFYNLDTRIHNKAEIKTIIEAKYDIIMNNPSILEKVLSNYDIDKETFVKFTNIIKNYGNQIYIYIYLIKFINTYCSNYIPENSSLDINNINKVFVEFLKVNNACLANIGIPELVDGNQHDAQEYIITFLDIINDCHSIDTIESLPKYITDMTEKEFIDLPLSKRLSIGIKKTFYNHNKLGISNIKNNMYFYTAQFITCNNCNYDSISFQENCMLNLPIPKIDSTTSIISKETTIYDCLDLYFNVEIMDHEYKCDKCTTKAINNKLSKRIMTLSNSLIIYFKRFNFDINTMSMTKNKTYIKYPFILNLSKYYISSNETCNSTITYKLKSVICHTGVLNYGHYYSFVCKKDAMNNDVWYRCNDDKVDKVPLQLLDNEIINSNAYILFYEKM